MNDLTLDSILLYPDNHAILLYTKGADTVADVMEQFGPVVSFKHGCLKLTKGMAELVRTVATVNVKPASVDNGTEATKSLDIKVAQMVLRPRECSYDVILPSFPDLIPCEWMFMPAARGTFEEHAVARQFREYRVRNVIKAVAAG